MDIGQITQAAPSYFTNVAKSFKNIFNSRLTYEQHRQIVGHSGAILTGMNALSGELDLLNPLTWLKPQNLLNFAAFACLIPGMQWLMLPVAVFYGIKAVGHALKALGSLNPFSEKGIDIGELFSNAIAAFFTAISAVPLGRVAGAYAAFKIGLKQGARCSSASVGLVLGEQGVSSATIAARSQTTKVCDGLREAVGELYGPQAARGFQTAADTALTSEGRNRALDKAADTYVRASNGFREKIQAAEERFQEAAARQLQPAVALTGA